MRWIFALAFSPSLAFGHAGDMVDSLDLKTPTNNDPSVAIESTIGLLWAANGNDFQWVCHESVTQADTLMTPRYVRSSAGFTLATVPKQGEGRESNEVVYRSTDHCDWQPVSGLTGQVVVDFAIDPSSPDTVFAIANHPVDTAGNGVRISTDGGLNWSSTALENTDRQFASILAKDGEIWASSVHFATQTAWIYRSVDQGDSWQEWTLELTDYASPPELLLLEKYDTGIWFRVTQTLSDDLWTLDLNENQPRLVYGADTKIMSAAHSADGSLYLAMWTQGVGHLQNETLTLIPDSPISYAVRADGNSLYAATRPLFAGHGMMISSDGLVFEDAFDYSDLGSPPACDAGSHSTLYCEPLWEELSERLVKTSIDTGDTGDTGTETPPTETNSTETAKGCKNSGSGQAGILFVLPLLFRRRYRSTNP